MKVTACLSLGCLGLAHAAGSNLFDSDLLPRYSKILPFDEHGTIASLFGSSKARDRFFTDHFGSDVVHMKRSESELPAPIEKVDILSLFKSSEMTLRTWGSSDKVDKRKMSYEDVEEYIASGGSAVVHIVADEIFLSLKKHIEESLGLRVSMNVYRSGPNGVALYPHTDRYDVFVLHLEGEKTWEICIPEDLSQQAVDFLSAADISDLYEVTESNVAGCTTHKDESFNNDLLQPDDGSRGLVVPPQRRCPFCHDRFRL
jgi:Cupin superfamily protein